MHWLDYIIIATYIAQIYQICFFAVPSAGSTVEMLANRKRKSVPVKRHAGAIVVHANLRLVGTIGATLAVVTASMIPLLTVLFPVVNRYLLAFIKMPPPTGLSLISASLLLLGNALTFLAVATLRANVSFHEFGETTCLYTAGIYRTIRNPITVGLGIIFGGFVLARPSVVMLIGWLIFALNSHYRIRLEEVYLESAFGNDYLHYKAGVGKYVPKVGGHSIAKLNTINEGHINHHRGRKMQK